ncbi:MAG: L,D-transpeptidase [Xanthobacteraceae bacterium]|nr:L,D-transpeptidase [Xanthobacteraceae bacterium]
MTALIALPLSAHAQFFWPNNRFDDDEIIVRPPSRPLQHAAPHQRVPRAKTVIKETAKPQGPLFIAISIDSQEMKIYDNNGLFAQTPVSTGMRGHSTPMGVFSILAKEKYHRSNIYSNAPMPYMQRITWSGVAMHAGVLPGYPASHGCIRMPMNFAVRMYGWTKNGARVVIAPGSLVQTDISNPLLFTKRPDPPKTAAVTESTNPIPAGTITTPKADRDVVALSQEPKPSEFTAADVGVKSTNKTAEPLRTADASGSAPTLPVTDIAPKTDKDQARPDDQSSPAITSPQVGKPVEAAVIDTKPAVPAPNGLQPDATTKDISSDPAKAAAAPKRWGHIAAFISRKEGKLFVRQNFEPLFEVPVTIAAGGPLGTHVFTMRASKDDPKTFQWSVMSLPQRERLEPVSSRKKLLVNDTIRSPSASPTEALDRIKIPDDAMQRLAQIFAPGDSLTVSELGLGGETGRGTDFIIPLR